MSYDEYAQINSGLSATPVLTTVPVNELLTIKFPPKEHLLAPWLSTQDLAMIYAPRGIGKTHVSLGIACAVATGSEFLGWKAPEKRRVLFIDGEMAGVQLQERLHATLKGMGCDTADDIPLHIMTPDLQEHGLPDLASEEGQKLIEQHIPQGTELIIIDNLSTLVRSGKENEGEGWQPIQQWAINQRTKQRSVLFIHHAGKNGQQRGSSRREDVLDTVIALKRPSDYTPEQGASFEVSFEKSRNLHGEQLAPFIATLDSGGDSHQWETTRSEESTFEKVVDMSKLGMSPVEITNELGVARSTVSRHLQKARAQGRV